MKPQNALASQINPELACKNHRKVNKTTIARIGKPPLELLVRVGPPRTWKSDPTAGDTICIRHRTQKESSWNWPAKSSKPTFHSIESALQDTKGEKQLIVLGSCKTKELQQSLTMAKGPQECNAGTYLLGAINSFLLGLKAPLGRREFMDGVVSSEVIASRGKYSIGTFLNQYNYKCLILSPYPYILR